MSPWGTRNGHQPLGRGNSLLRSACPILWSNPILKRYFMDIASVYSLALRLRNTKVPVWTHESMGYPKMDISHWDAAIHYGFQLSQYCDQTQSCRASLRRLPPMNALALRLRNTKVPVGTHESIGYPKMDISHWDAAIHYGVQLAQYCDQTRSCNASLRRLPPVYCLDLRLRNTKVPVWTQESMGYPKMDISHWDAAIHYGVHIAQYCDQTRSWNATLWISPLCTPLPWVSWTPKYLCWLMSPSGTRKWTSAIGTRQFTMAFSLPNIVIKPDHVALVYGYRPCVLPCPMTQEHRSTCVDSWVHRVPENGHQPLGCGNSLWRSACQILWSTWSCSASLWRLPPVYSLALELRNTKVPVLIHESMRYPKMDISHWEAAIHYGVQLAQYCDQTRSWNPTLWILPLCTPWP